MKLPTMSIIIEQTADDIIVATVRDGDGWAYEKSVTIYPGEDAHEASQRASVGALSMIWARHDHDAAVKRGEFLVVEATDRNAPIGDN